METRAAGEPGAREAVSSLQTGEERAGRRAAEGSAARGGERT